MRRRRLLSTRSGSGVSAWRSSWRSKWRLKGCSDEKRYNGGIPPLFLFSAELEFFFFNVLCFFFFCSWLLLCILVCFVCVALISLRCAYTPFIPLSLSFLLCNLSVRNVELFYPFLLCVFEGSNLNTVFFFSGGANLLSVLYRILW